MITNENGETIISAYYEIIGEPEYVSLSSGDPSNYYVYDADSETYIAYENIGSLGTVQGKNPYTIARVYYDLTSTSYPPGSLYLPNIYYYEEESSHNYIKDSNSTLTEGR